MSVRSLLLIAPLVLVAAACGTRRSAQEFVQRGDQQAAAGHYGAAALEYRNAIRKEPARAEVHRKLAGTYAALGRLELANGGIVQARALSARALALAPDAPDALLLAARTAIASNDPSAEGYLTRAIAAAPSAFEARALLANQYAAHGDLDRARTTLEQFANQHPNAAAPRTALGIVLEEAGRPAEARVRYEQALALAPGEPVASNNLARLYVSDDARVGEAVELARNAVARLPNDADAHDTLGWVAFRAGRLSLAKSELERAVALAAAEPSYRNHLENVNKAIEEEADAAAARKRSE